MRKRKIIIIIIAAILLCIMLMAFFGNPVVLINGYKLGNAVKNVSTDTIALNEITPFDWDIAYSFMPYTSKKEIESVIGFGSNEIIETVSEGMVQLIFVKENKVVCNIQGYSSNLGYSISIWKGAEQYCLVKIEDDISLSVDRRDNIVFLVRN